MEKHLSTVLFDTSLLNMKVPLKFNINCIHYHIVKEWLNKCLGLKKKHAGDASLAENVVSQQLHVFNLPTARAAAQGRENLESSPSLTWELVLTHCKQPS